MSTNKTKRDNFSAPVKRKMAERAGYICSNPSCNRVTIGPENSDPNKSSSIGVAAHICAAASGGPRYDMSQTSIQRGSIKNGIWLCASCSTVIDNNNGLDYPAEHLRKWKRDHEALIKSCIEGSKRIAFQSHSSKVDERFAKQLLATLEDKGALYMPYHQERQLFVIESLKELRQLAITISPNLDYGSQLQIILDSIAEACRYYMNTTSVDADVQEIEYSLGALRKIIGLNIGQLIQHYNLSISSQLQAIVPR